MTKSGARKTSQKARDAAAEGRASPPSLDGMTAREAAERYCSIWAWADYCGAWPSRDAPNSHVPDEDQRVKTQRAVSDELRAMLRLAFDQSEGEEASTTDPIESQEVKPIRRGRLPMQKRETSQVPIIAGLLNGDVSRLKVDAQGAWTLEPREDAFAGKPVGGKAKNVKERYIVTRDDGATCRLTITLKITEKRMRTKGGPVKPTKRAVYVGEKLSSWTHKRHPIRRREKLANLARAQAFIRTVHEVEHFAGPAPVPLRAEGRSSINEPRIKLVLDDIRNIKIDIKENSAFGDGRKFHGLRFFEASLSPPSDLQSSLTTEERTWRLQEIANAIHKDNPAIRKRNLAVRVHARLANSDTLLDRREAENEKKKISAETVERLIRMPRKGPRRPF